MISRYAIATWVVFIISIFFAIHPVSLPTRPITRIPIFAEGVKSYNIIISFFSLAYMAITDVSILEVAAFWVSNRGNNGWKLYLYFHLMLANTTGLLWALFVRSPTNVAICKDLGVDNATFKFTAYSTLPFLACNLFALAFQYCKQVLRKSNHAAHRDPRSALLDLVGAWIGSFKFMLGTTLILCLVVRLSGIDVWMISSLFAFGEFLFDLGWDHHRYSRDISMLGCGLPMAVGEEVDEGSAAERHKNTEDNPSHHPSPPGVKRLQSFPSDEEIAVESTMDGKVTRLHSRAESLAAKFRQGGGRSHVDEAIDFDREALQLCPPGHPKRSISLSHLSRHLLGRFNQFGATNDFEEAIVLGRQALDLCPQRHPERFTSLNNLADGLFTRYKQLGGVGDLDGAIALLREALDLRPHGHPDRSDSLKKLARYLCDRFMHLRQLEDEEEVFSLYAQLARVPQIVSSADISAARAWIRMARRFQHPTLLLAYETSLRLLTQHLATLPSLRRHLAVLKNLTSSSLGVDAFSAFLHEGAPAHAVELLEQGRGVFWAQLTRLRSPLDDLAVSGPAGKALADEFTRLVPLIRNALNSPGPDQHQRLCRLNLEMDRVVTNVRGLPGLSRFLLPSLFPDLQRAASGGPVIIINASEYHCDALIVLADRDPIHIPLQITKEGVRDLSTELHTLTVRAKRVDVTRELATFLRKLWGQIVSPIVDVLLTIHPSQSRIWWCPTAEFSVLPLHAAGPYRKGQRNLPDIYISSYTPTLAALIRARLCHSSSSAQGKRFIAIGQAKAAGESELVSVGAELDNISQLVDGAATFTRIDGEESRISRVTEELGRNNWVHLACHGLPNPKRPFESAFALHDGHFTIQHIIGCDLKNPEFAYLSACHTTVGDEESPDEVIHLASAMHFAGFSSVIGTMWAVDDDETKKITTTFYKYMVGESGRLDHTCAAFALNKTMASVNVPFDQRILYIHLGV